MKQAALLALLLHFTCLITATPLHNNALVPLKRASADEATVYVVDKRESADEATVYVVDKRASADEATVYTVDKRGSADEATT
ncbi:hypothetical protein O1611_g3379 [Lasiodiplodia mahajangana]|uniref:Uncharacterized protein n=1 Tax=Lasiodiplodia mahajangana TaxID=1108764 RepID=A0ACC2JRY6_9PEZI|nr:hypothetical protein O1611_g3379 [Lasiodiplodia mahajangana]